MERDVLTQAGLPTSERGRIFPSIGLLLVQLIVAWEWLDSGLTKVFLGGFPSGLGSDLTEQSKDAAAWYRSFLDSVVIPNGSLFGYLIMITEVVIGIVLLATALAWLLRWESLGRRQRDAVLLLTVVACAVAVSLNVGLYLASGDPLPFFLGKSVFDEGISLDVILPAIELILGGVALWTYLSIRRGRTSPSRA